MTVLPIASCSLFLLTDLYHLSVCSIPFSKRCPKLGHDVVVQKTEDNITDFYLDPETRI